MAQGQLQAVSDIDPHQSPSQEAKYTNWITSENFKSGSNKLQKQHIQMEITAGTKTCSGESYYVWSVPE